MSVVLDVDFRTTRWEGLPPDQTRAGSLGNEFQLLGTTPRWYCSGWLTAPLADFVWEVQARLAEEDEGAWAVTFGNDNGEPGQGEVAVGSDGRIRVRLLQDGLDLEELIPWTKTPALRPITEPNLLRVEMVDRAVRVFVNGRYVAEAAHPRYKPGKLMLLAWAAKSRIDARFQQIRIWRVPAEAK